MCSARGSEVHSRVLLSLRRGHSRSQSVAHLQMTDCIRQNQDWLVNRALRSFCPPEGNVVDLTCFPISRGEETFRTLRIEN